MKKRKRRRRQSMRLLLGVLTAVCCIFLIVVIAKEMKKIRAEEEAQRQEQQKDEEKKNDVKEDSQKDAKEDLEEDLKEDSGEELDGENTVLPEKIEDTEVKLTISAAGDCTLGTDVNFAPATSFTTKYKQVGDPGYFFREVKSIFEADDLTIVNMEGTLTEENTRAQKTFAFKAEPSYVKILTEGSVEAANLANNHSRDYGEKSYQDTIDALESAGVHSFGYDRTALLDIKGIKVGLVGTYELASGLGCQADMEQNIAELKAQGAQLVVASFHWGTEKENIPDSIQKQLAHAAVDAGADLVLGHHPHVLQGIEEYKGKNILYSLGNFCFGGNKNPADKDTMIFQQTFTFRNGVLVADNQKNIIPCSLSSNPNINNYQPIPVEGERKEAILKRIEEYSAKIG